MTLLNPLQSITTLPARYQYGSLSQGTGKCLLWPLCQGGLYCHSVFLITIWASSFQYRPGYIGLKVASD